MGAEAREGKGGNGDKNKVKGETPCKRGLLKPLCDGASESVTLGGTASSPSLEGRCSLEAFDDSGSRGSCAHGKRIRSHGPRRYQSTLRTQCVARLGALPSFALDLVFIHAQNR